MKTGAESGIINTVNAEATNEGRQGLSLRNGGKWFNGKNTQRQVPGVESGAGQAQSRGEVGGYADSEIARFVNEGREVTVADLGILGGSKYQKVRILDREHDTKDTREAREYGESRGLNVIVITGGAMQIEGKFGKIDEVNGYILGKNMIIRADHSTFTSTQIARHEGGHDMIAKGEVDIKAVRNQIKKVLQTDEGINEAAKHYEEAYSGTGLTADEIWEEMICDSLGDMNIFSKSEKRAAAAEVMKHALPAIQQAVAETKTEGGQETRGSPEGKASRDMSDEDYKNFGWVRDKNVISAGHWKSFTTNFADAVARKYYFNKSKAGDFMIEAYNYYDPLSIADVIVFARGTIESPVITKIIRLKKNYGIDLDAKREVIYEAERRGISPEIGEIFEFYYRTDYTGEFGVGRNGEKGNGDNNQLGAKRSRSEITANPVVKSEVNEDAGTVTVTYKNGDVVTEPWGKGKASRELDVDSTEYKINTSMTMAEAKRMIDTTFKVNEIAKWYEGEYANADEWLKKAGADEVEMYIDNDFDLQEKYINSNEDILNEEYSIRDVLNAYLAGTLIGKEKPKPVRLDVSQSTRLKDERFYSPQKIEDAKKTFEIANQKAVGKDEAKVNRARAEILLFAHNKGAAELLGVTQSELNKKLRSWSRYSATAKKISEAINEGVAEENRWTGIENCSYVSRARVSNEDLERLVGTIEGDSRGYERKYIARVMLAADTHIDYSGLNFKFASSQQVNEDNKSDGRVLGFYRDEARLVEVSHDKPNTVAHEMGHYIDAQWGRELVGSNGSHLFLSNGVNADIVRERYGEQGVQFLKNFKLFINSLSDVNTNLNAYQNDRKEIFARFFARFVEWTDNIATGNSYYRYETTRYNDQFTQAQYLEFARLLQEKALLDGTVKETAKYSRELDIDAMFEDMDWEDLMELGGSTDATLDDISEELSAPKKKVEIFFRRKGLGNSYIAAGKSAVMKQSRIDEAIEDSGAKFNPDYARKYITRISPSDFIDLTVKRSHMDRNAFDAEVEGDRGSKMGDYDYDKALKEARNPYLRIYKATGEVFGHNGRHRMRALELAGIESVEIEIELYDEDGYLIKNGAKTIEDMAISSQFDTAIETHLSNVIPLNEVHRSEIESSYGEKVAKEGDVKYSRELDLDYDENAEATKTVTNRDILANALESAAQNDAEYSALQSYKANIKELNKKTYHLSKLKEEIKNLSFGKGQKDAKRLAELKEKAAKLERSINYYDRQLVRLEAMQPVKDLVQRERSKAYKAAAEKGREALKQNIEGRHKSEARAKIKKLKQKFQSIIEHPTDRQYVPVDLMSAMVDVCELIDTSTPLYKADGSINKAQQARNEQTQRLLKLKAEYDALAKSADYAIAYEYEQEVADYIQTITLDYANRNISEMTLAELTDLYQMMRSIEETLRDARRLIGWSDAMTVYEAGDSIIEEQTKIGENRKQNGITKADDAIVNLSLSPVRAVLRMAGYNEDSALYQSIREIENGTREQKKFVMDAVKKFESLTTGKNASTYEKAIYDPYGKELIDKNGNKFHVTKMQMMQAIMSYEREMVNDKLHHVSNGGFTFADITLLGKGEIREAVSAKYAHTITLGSDVAVKFMSELANDKWAQEYMAEARNFFDVTAKEAINEANMKLKHRIIATGKNYIPYEVNSDFIVREINSENDIQQVISGYGMLKDLKEGASQPLIITGLNNVLDRHIEQVGNVAALAVPIRNFNKIWNVKSTDGSTTVREKIKANWGTGGEDLITQAVKDVQGSRKRDNSPIYKIYKNIKSGIITGTFLGNWSVVLKQIGSMYTATSMLNYRDPASMMVNLLATKANRDAIAAEVNKYTAVAWVRGQGLSDAELYDLKTTAKKSKIGRAVDKLPPALNAAKWITQMDYDVALSLWKYAKEDTAKRTGLKGEELLRATADYYNDVIENTQSMSDALHRPEVQKSDNIASETLGIFKTDLYQNAGLLRVAFESRMANPSKETTRALVKAVCGTLSSMCWASLITSVMAAFRYKVGRYRDEEDDEITLENWLKVSGGDMLEEMFGYMLPLFGSEAAGLLKAWITGETYEFDNLTLEAINGLSKAITSAGKLISEGEDDPEKIQRTLKNLLVKATSIFGVPANNVTRFLDAVRLHAKDIANGEFLSFEAELTSPNAQRLYNAYIEGDADKIEKASRNFEDQKAIDAALRKKLRDNDPRIEEAANARLNGDFDTYEEIVNEIVGEGRFDKDLIVDAIKAEASAIKSKQEEDTEEEEEEEKATSIYQNSDVYTSLDLGNVETARKIVEDLVKVSMENGKTEKEAKSTIKSSLTTHYKPLYLAAYKSGNTEEMKRIRYALKNSGLYSSVDEITSLCSGWIKNNK